MVLLEVKVVNRTYKLTVEQNLTNTFLSTPHYTQSLISYLTENTACFHQERQITSPVLSVPLNHHTKHIRTMWEQIEESLNLQHDMYMNQQDAQNSCDQTLFSIRCSTCFGLYQSTIRSNFISCTSHLVYAGTIRVAVVWLQPHNSHTYRHIPNAMYSL